MQHQYLDLLSHNCCLNFWSEDNIWGLSKLTWVLICDMSGPGGTRDGAKYGLQGFQSQRKWKAGQRCLYSWDMLRLWGCCPVDLGWMYDHFYRGLTNSTFHYQEVARICEEIWRGNILSMSHGTTSTIKNYCIYNDKLLAFYYIYITLLKTDQSTGQARTWALWDRQRDLTVDTATWDQGRHDRSCEPEMQSDKPTN
jgi:hypothetical protein